MTSPVTSQSQATARAPQFSATVVYDHYREIRLTQLIAALKTIAPSSVLGDWSGSFAVPPSDALGTDVVSLDGISLTLLNVDKALPHSFSIRGPFQIS